jgi:cytochrome c
MFTRKFSSGCAALVMTTAMVLAASGVMAQSKFGIGKAASESEIKAWDIDVSPNGAGLPVGSGSVAQGGKLYAEKCAACHGPKGEGKPADRLVGGQGTLKAANPVKTIGSFWPYATTVFDYVYRAMPYTAPQSLSASETYALTAYLLHMNGILGAEATLDAASLPKIRMPNRDGFIGDGRPDTTNVPCRVECN